MPITEGNQEATSIDIGNGTGNTPANEATVNGVVFWQRTVPFNPNTVTVWTPDFVAQTMGFTQMGTDANGIDGERQVAVDATMLANIDSTVLGPWTVSNDIDPAFTFENITITQTDQLPEDGLDAGDSLAGYVTANPIGTVTITDALAANPGNADRNVNVNIT